MQSATSSPARFLSPTWTETEAQTELIHQSRRGKRNNGSPTDCAVSRSWHAGCPTPNTRATVTTTMTTTTTTASQPNSNSGPNLYSFGQLFRASPLPTLPAELCPGYESATSASFLAHSASRLPSPGTPRRIRISSGGTGRVSKTVLLLDQFYLIKLFTNST